MKKWSWSNSTNTIWTNFDCGEVIAETREQAYVLASEEFNKNLEEANTALKATGLEIHACDDDMQIECIGEVRVPKTIRIAFWCGSYDCPYEAGQEFPYSRENLAEITETIMFHGLNSMIQTTGIDPDSESIILWIDDRKFTAR